ncbi:MAG: Gx transporter family protein [Clostridium sp.]|nr:Gx transporter family protein [Clostridium sp.]
MRKTSNMVYIGLLVAQALVLHIIERSIPVPFITPGAKLGLANLITVIALYTLDNKRDAFLILFLRLLLSTMFGGNLSSLMYSTAGGVLSFISMVAVKELFKDKVSIVGVSSTGAIFHNIGQLLIASLIVKNIGVMLYLPILSTIGIGTGIFVGIAANYIVAQLKKLPMFKR